MKIFLDSADVKEIKDIYDFGIIDGITTNPSLIAKAGINFKENVKAICESVLCDVSVEVASNEFKEMLEEGNKILEIADNIVIKLPITWNGIKACRYFSDQGKKVNMTLCFSANQALIAAIAGAYYVSPFIGRLDDIGQEGMELIREIKKIYDNYKDSINTKILAASIRSSDHILKAALNGADAVTIPYGLIKKLINHPLTESGLKVFNQDWINSGLKIL